MTPDKDEKPRSLGLSPTQVIGSALAAMSAAFFASWAGTAGTMIGAALGSVLFTVGAATYTWSLRRTSEAARRTAVLVRQRAQATGTLARPDPGVFESDDPDAPVPDPNAPRAGDPESSQLRTADDETPNRDGRLATLLDLPWLKVALASFAVLVVALGGITAVEAITGKPIASWFGRGDSTGTSVEHVFGSDSGSSKPDRTPEQETPATPQPSPSQAPSEQPQEPAPSTNATPTPTTGQENPAPSPGSSEPPTPDDVQP